MLLQLKDIHFSYGERSIFRGLNLVLNQNESIAIMASSGSGKTTLFKILTQFIFPNKGKVVFDNEISIGDFSYIRQSSMNMLFPWKTVKGNIEFPLKERGLLNRSTQKRIDELVQRLQIEHLLSSKPKDLSGGEKKRVSIACGLSYSPKIILLDEAFTGIDMQLKLKLWSFFKEEITSKQKASSLIITHDIDEALYLSDKILFLTDGIIKDKQLIVPKNNYGSIEDYLSDAKIISLKKEILSTLEQNTYT